MTGIFPADLWGGPALEDQDLRLLQDLDDQGLVLEPVDVFVAVSVAGLEHLDELLVQLLDGRQVATADLKVVENFEIKHMLKEILCCKKNFMTCVVKKLYD